MFLQTTESQGVFSFTRCFCILPYFFNNVTQCVALLIWGCIYVILKLRASFIFSVKTLREESNMCSVTVFLLWDSVLFTGPWHSAALDFSQVCFTEVLEQKSKDRNFTNHKSGRRNIKLKDIQRSSCVHKCRNSVLEQSKLETFSLWGQFWEEAAEYQLKNRETCP